MDNKILNTGNVIRNKRKSLGLSTIKLSKLLGISVGLLNNIENGKTDCFNLKLLYKISNTLQLSILDIIGYDISAYSTNKEILDVLPDTSKTFTFQLLIPVMDILNSPNWSEEKTYLLIKRIYDEADLIKQIP